MNKRSIAIIIAVVVISSSTLIGVRRSVAAEVRQIEAQFYEGVTIKEANNIESAIDLKLDERIDAALGIVTIASNVSSAEIAVQTETLRHARLALLDAESIADKYIANAKLEEVYQALIVALKTAALPEHAQAALLSHSQTLESAGAFIKGSHYNQLAEDFTDELTGTFPTNFFSGLGLVEFPEYFGLRD